MWIHKDSRIHLTSRWCDCIMIPHEMESNSMHRNVRTSPFPLRLDEEIKGKAKAEAGMNRRSLNAELGLLIEEGLKWREMQQSKRAVA
jgi:hypothetical protein